MDFESGIVFLEKNPDARREPASLAKIVTASLLLERMPEGYIVKVSANAARQSGALLGLKAGDTISLGDALTAMLLESDNDAAVAAAEAAAGNVEKFAAWMNAWVAQIGARNTRFVNPTGAHDPRQYTTARDMALIARAALRNPKFADLVRTRTATVKWSAKPQGKQIANRNRMLGDYQGAEGIKTGSTSQAGDCLAAAARRDGWRLIAVVLGASDAKAEATALLNRAFAQYKRLQMLERGKTITQARIIRGRRATVPLAAAESFWLVIPKKIDPVWSLSTAPEVLTAPVRRGQQAGQVTVFVNGRPRATVPLLATESVPLSRWLFLHWLKAPAAALLLFLATYWALLRARQRGSAAEE